PDAEDRKILAAARSNRTGSTTPLPCARTPPTTAETEKGTSSPGSNLLARRRRRGHGPALRAALGRGAEVVAACSTAAGNAAPAADVPRSHAHRGQDRQEQH